jgi:trk system potassium uptake protein TrkH
LVQRILGTLIMWYGATLVPPMLVSMLYRDGQMPVFFIAAALIVVVGFALWFPARAVQHELSLREGFLVVAAFWLVLGPIAAAPFLVAAAPEMSFTGAVFEAVSGMTTTGATVLTGLDQLPKSILYYRQQITWVGGIGIVVLAVAVLPMLGVGGMQLYKAESPGQSKDKLTPRIKETAKALWIVYLGLTVLCALSYWLAGMDLFDAIAHSYTTIATGGFSTHDASFLFWDNPLLDGLATLFMFLGGVNFALHFVAWQRLDPRHYLRDLEFDFYLKVTLGLIALITVYLVWQGTYPGYADALRHAAFNYVSMATSTGFVNAEFDKWPGFAPMLLILVGFMGACAGSTSGGIKVVRFLIMFKQALVEIRRLLHPRAEVPLVLGARAVPDRVVQAVVGYIGVYIMVFVVLYLALLATGLDYVSAFTGLASCMNNVGPGLGQVFYDVRAVSDAGQWILTAAMILGRLEIYTLIILLTPEFWRR